MYITSPALKIIHLLSAITLNCTMFFFGFSNEYAVHMFIIYLKEENILKLITVHDKTGIKMGILILEWNQIN